MIPLIAAVFTASLLGSMHCAGMCGAFVAFAVSLDAPGPTRPRWRLQAGYNLGRLATYIILGAIAGSLGSAFNSAGELFGLQRAAVMLAGLCMVIFGAIAILRLQGVKIPKPRTPKLLERIVTGAMRKVVAQPPLTRAILTGMTTTLLPCGWLYAFVITAAGTAHPLYGVITMFVFWAGTLPMMVAIGTGVQTLTNRLGGLGRHAPLVVSAAVIAIGLLNVFDPQRLQRITMPAAPLNASLVNHVESLDSSDMPCCHDHAPAHDEAPTGR